MGRNQIIIALSNDKELREICKKITRNSEIWEDLYQHCLIRFFEVSQAIIDNVEQNKKEKAYLIKIMLNEWTNKYSEFNKTYATSITYNKQDYITSITSDTTSIDACKFDIDQTLKYFTTITPETIQATKTLEKIKREDNNKGSGFPYRTELFKLYLKEGSSRNIQKSVGIHYCSASKTLKQIKEQIKKGE